VAACQVRPLGKITAEGKAKFRVCAGPSCGMSPPPAPAELVFKAVRQPRTLHAPLRAAGIRLVQVFKPGANSDDRRSNANQRHTIYGPVQALSAIPVKSRESSNITITTAHVCESVEAWAPEQAQHSWLPLAAS
jgi:hypothetical protein